MMTSAEQEQQSVDMHLPQTGVCKLLSMWFLR